MGGLPLRLQVGLVNSYESSMNARFSDIESVESQRSIRELNEFIKLVKDNNIQLGIVMFPFLSWQRAILGNTRLVIYLTE